MSALMIKTRSAPRLTIIQNPDDEDRALHCVRAYRATPEDVYIQLRWRGRFVGAYLTRDEARQLGEHLIREAGDC